MPNIVDRAGYLSEPYLTGPYLTDGANHGVLSQVELVIESQHPVNSQTEQRIDAEGPRGSQVESAIQNLPRPLLSEVDQRIDSSRLLASQAEQRIDTQRALASQTDREIKGFGNLQTQAEKRIDAQRPLLSEIDRLLGDQSGSVRSQINRGANLHAECGDGYLNQPYLSTPYLAPRACVHLRSEVDRQIVAQRPLLSQAIVTVESSKNLRSQIEQRIDTTRLLLSEIEKRIDAQHPLLSQIERRIDTQRALLSEIERRIDTTDPLFSQINRARAQRLLSQITIVLYNTTNLRVMCDFPSRGTSGTNWTSNSTEPGDFSPYNLNTDIEEQVWRSASGVKTGLILTCDTEVAQGVFVDTLAIRSHNLTTSATVVWQRSNDPGFGSSDDITLTVASDHIYYIAPTLPSVSYRYHRFQINDPTNTADSIQIGTILFGSSVIFQGECFVDQVIRQTVAFADKIETEGFTNVSNDRALKFSIGLDFRSLQFNRGNYDRLRGVFEYARTSLKCLWIPTPGYPSRYATFGKLSGLPAERHNDRGADADYISFSINVDESL